MFPPCYNLYRTKAAFPLQILKGNNPNFCDWQVIIPVQLQSDSNMFNIAKMTPTGNTANKIKLNKKTQKGHCSEAA